MTKNIGLCFAIVLLLGALSACGQTGSPNSENPSETSQNIPSNTSNEGMSSPIVAPPSFDNRPPKPGQMPTQETMPNGLPALQPLKGVNVDKLFAEKISDNDRRFNRVENAVLDLRKEFEVMKPAIVRLVAVEGDIQTLVEQLEAMASEETNRIRSMPRTPPPVTPKMTEPKPTITEPAAPVDLTPEDITPAPDQIPQEKPASQPTPMTSGPTVQNLRTGQHSGKIRIVLDTSENTPYTMDLDTSENILLIELPEAKWSGPSNKAFSSSTPLLKAYSVEPINNGKGARIIVALKKATSILEKKTLSPERVPNYRIYVDLKT